MRDAEVRLRDNKLLGINNVPSKIINAVIENLAFYPFFGWITKRMENIPLNLIEKEKKQINKKKKILGHLLNIYDWITSRTHIINYLEKKKDITGSPPEEQ